MASHDYVIDNQTAPNFRADLNNALLAIVSTNSGASAPAVTYANMLWYDTTNNLLRMRNEDNDAFITLGTLNQVADTFSPAGLIIASQAEAEAGTNNTNLMTPLRVEQAINVIDDSALVSTGMAGLAVGSIGTYAYLGSAADGTITAGAAYAGSDLRFAGHAAESNFTDNTASAISATAPSGTWRAMGSQVNSATRQAITLYLRIS
jgi:hypothetical protein